MAKVIKAEEGNSFITVVADGASAVTYMDDLGQAHITHKFCVIVLRHNPSDMFPPYPLIPKGTIDLTGPMFWLKLWPERDPNFAVSPELHSLQEIFRQCIGPENFVDNSDTALKKTSELDQNSCRIEKEVEEDQHDLQFASDPAACDAPQPRKDSVGTSEAFRIEELGAAHSCTDVHE